MDDKFINRIKALLAKADPKRGSTEEEAALYAAKVQELLQTHGLTMAEIEARGESTGEDGKRAENRTDRRALFKWQQELMAALADNFFCYHMVKTVEAHDGRKLRKSKQHVLIGRWVNVQTAINMYDYLVKAIRRAAEDHGYDHANNEKQHHMFLEGATSRLRVRLWQQRNEREQEEARRRKERETASRHPSAAPDTGTALVLADVYQNEVDLNNDVRYGYEPGTTTRHRLELEAKARARDEKIAAYQAQGFDYDMAWYMVWGMTEDQARKRCAEVKKEDATRYQRQSRRSSWTQADERAAQRQSSTAYRHGTKAADNIGLDTQVGHDSKRRIRQ